MLRESSARVTRGCLDKLVLDSGSEKVTRVEWLFGIPRVEDIGINGAFYLAGYVNQSAACNFLMEEQVNHLMEKCDSEVYI